MNKYLITLTLSSTLLFLQGCGSISNNTKMQEVKKITEKNVKFNNTFLQKVEKPKEVVKKIITKPERKITFKANQMSILDVIDYALKDYSVFIKDNGVDLNKKISIQVMNMSEKDFFEKIFERSGYDYEIEGTKLSIFSMVKKVWNLSAMNSNYNSKSNFGAVDSLSISSEKENDKWQSIVSGISKILEQTELNKQNSDIANNSLREPRFNPRGNNRGFVSNGFSPAQEVKNKSWFISDRELGIITAYGTVNQIQKLSAYLDDIKKLSLQQIQLEVKAYEVTLNDNASTGINWSLLTTDTDAGEFINIGAADKLVNNLGSLATNTVGVELGAKVGKMTLKAMLNFLKQHGEVHLVTEPTITSLNGGTSFLSSGDSITHVSGFEILPVEGSSPIVYPKTSKIDLGTSISLTPRIADNNKIVIDVLATLKSLKKMSPTTISEFGITITSPEIAVQEISTQVIANNNEAVRLGGLIIQRMSYDTSKSPDVLGFVGEAFNSNYNSLEKRELVLIITPKILSNK